MERIYLVEVMQYLKYKDIRSCRSWCLRHNLGLLRDKGSKNFYVLQIEFEAALNKKAIEYLNEKYGTLDLGEIFSKYLANFPQSKNTTKEKDKKIKIYQPQGEHEKTFLTSLLNETPEL